jgi:SAM-dependent methyltransferase
MQAKPRHWGPEHARQWRDASMARAYPCRPPYPPETFARLRALVAGPAPHRVLDIGCGTGDIARGVAPLVDHVDAVDLSGAMLAIGRGLPGGDRRNLRWIEADAEAAPAGAPYALVTAGESIHWMDWSRLFPRLHGALHPAGVLCIVERNEARAPWSDGLGALIPRFSTNRDFRPADVCDELRTRGWFTEQGRHTTGSVEVVQSVDEYVEAMHSRNGFSRDRMTPESALGFDREFRDLLARHSVSGEVRLQVSALLVWGRPLPGLRGEGPPA